MGKLALLADYGREQFAMGFPEKFAGEAREKVRPPILDMDTGDTITALQGALRRAFDGSDSPVKRIAKAENCGPRTAENHWEGRNLPSLVQALRLGAAVPEFGAELRRLMGMESDLDPELERNLAALVQSAMKLKGRQE